MNKPLKVLIIEDSELDALLLAEHLRKGGYEPEFRRVDSAAGLRTALIGSSWDIIFSDHSMPGFSSFAALEIVRGMRLDVPFLIVSGVIGEEVAVAAMKAGAQDYIMKGNLARLVAAVNRELADAESRRARRVAERALLAREEELRIAREIQQQLFPAARPASAGYDIAGASSPAEATGGDYFDFIAGPGGEIYIVVGDVTGHGLGSALLMADARAYLRALVLSNRSFEDIMVQARRLLLEDLGNERFITMLFAQLMPPTGLLNYINAGHPTGYVISPDGHVRVELAARAPALGIDDEHIRLMPKTVPLETGDIVVLLTDGILEAPSSSGEEFGVARVLETVCRERARPSAEIIRALFDELRRFTGAVSFQDDVTTVVAKRLAG